MHKLNFQSILFTAHMSPRENLFFYFDFDKESPPPHRGMHTFEFSNLSINIFFFLYIPSQWTRTYNIYKLQLLHPILHKN